MILSLHIADVGLRRGPALLRTQLKPTEVEGLRYARMTIAAPLGPRLLPAPKPGRVVLVAAWEEDGSFDRFLAGHPLAAQLAKGWHVRLAPTRVFGAWPAIEGLPRETEQMDDEEPVAVLTLGRLRLTQTLRFLRASAKAEGLVVEEPAVLACTGLARPPHLVATFSLWRTVGAMRAYAAGQAHPQHRAAVEAHAKRSFHHESAFIRLRPYAAYGTWDGREPLAEACATNLASSSATAKR